MYITDEVYCEEHEKYDAKEFLDFLKTTLSHYKSRKIVMILYNSKIHHSKLLKLFLEEVKVSLELMFLSVYTLELNLIEGLWGWLKSFIINNSLFLTLLKVRVSVNKFIEETNKVTTQIIDRLCLKL